MGPLAGLRIIEVGGIGPASFCGMLLGDLGCDVVRVDDPGAARLAHDPAWQSDLLRRGKRSLAVDLKQEPARNAVLAGMADADVVIEGFRPGVMERLGLGPAEVHARSPRVIYGRVTGWGREGPLAGVAGHDLNYIALSGVLGALGRPPSPPPPPLNLLGDFAGGGLLLAFGVLAALHERAASGVGQVVDTSMLDGVALLSTMVFGLLGAGRWQDRRAANVIDGACHYYNVYETADHRFVAVAAVEERFYRILLSRLGLDHLADVPRDDPAAWPRLTAEFGAAFRGRTLAEWCELMKDADACFAPVLTFSEALAHPQYAAGQGFVWQHGIVQPRPSPRFTRTGAALGGPPPRPGEHTRQVLAEWGTSAEQAAALIIDGAAFATTD